MKRKTARPLRVSVSLAMLCAISIVCGKLLAFNVGTFLRFSLENLPIILAGIMFGAVAGAAVGALADLLGSILAGYAINPIITIGAAAVGLLSGVVWRLLRHVRLPRWLRIVITVAAAHIVGSVLIKSVGLMVFYGMPFYLLLAWRTLNYLIVGAAEGAVTYILISSPALMRIMGRKD